MKSIQKVANDLTCKAEKPDLSCETIQKVAFDLIRNSFSSTKPICVSHQISCALKNKTPEVGGLVDANVPTQGTQCGGKIHGISDPNL